MSPQEIWLADSANAPRVTLEYVRDRVSSFDDRTRRERIRMVTIQSLGSVYLFWMIWTRFGGKPFMQILLASSIVAASLLLVRWMRDRKPLPFDPRAGVLDSLRYFHGELVRERDVRRRTWRETWMFNAVVIPLMFLLFVVELHRSWEVIAILTPLMAFTAVLNFLKFRRTVGSLEREIKGLDSLITN
jgi:hypothetical protein